MDTTTHSPSAKEGQMFATSGTPSGRAHVTRTPVSAVSNIVYIHVHINIVTALFLCFHIVIITK